MSHTVARCKKCKGFRRNQRENIKPIGPSDLHSVETMKYLPAFKKLFHCPLKKLLSVLPREYVINVSFHQLQWVMDTMINLKKRRFPCMQSHCDLYQPLGLFCLCLSSQNYREEMAIEVALSVCHGPKHSSGLDLSPPFGKNISSWLKHSCGGFTTSILGTWFQ